VYKGSQQLLKMEGLVSDRWSSSSGFALLHTAKDWGYKPSELGLCEPEEDLTLMVAYTSTVSDMEAVEKLDAEHKNT
jgi:hypothetical protein